MTNVNLDYSDSELVVLSSTGSMATRWLANSFSNNSDFLALHSQFIVKPTDETLDMPISKREYHSEKLEDYKLTYEYDSIPPFLDWLLKLRIERKKRKLIIVHTTPLHRDFLKPHVLERGGKFLMLAREPVQAIDSQYQEYEEFKYIRNLSSSKMKFYRSIVETFLESKGNDSMASHVTLDLLPFARLVIDYGLHIEAILKGIKGSVKYSKNKKLDFSKKQYVRNFAEANGFFRFEDYSTLKEQTLMNLYGLVAGEKQSYEYLTTNIFSSTRHNVHRKEKKSSVEILSNWHSSKQLILTRFFDCMNLFNMEYFFAKDCKDDPKLRRSSPLEKFLDYKVDGLY